MSAIPVAIRGRLSADLAAAREARRSGDAPRAWALLEDSHVLSQPWAVWHVRVHGAMLATGVHLRDVREVWGQLVRLVVAGPGSLTGRYPVGNTGRARVPATQPMPIREDLADLLREVGR
jgi:hypothetical protein